MPSLILQTAVRYLIPVQVMLSIILFLRGHNAPGGGFVGGLVAAAAITLYAIAYGTPTARRVLPLDPLTFIPVGLAMAVSSALYSALIGKTFMQNTWTEQEFPAIGALGTPFFFDLGVYFVVVGVALMIVFTLAEEELT